MKMYKKPKLILFIIIISIYFSNFAYASSECRKNQNCSYPGKCHDYIDEDSNNLCDKGEFISINTDNDTNLERQNNIVSNSKDSNNTIKDYINLKNSIIFLIIISGIYIIIKKNKK